MLTVACMQQSQDYLPQKVQEAFIATLTEFVLLPWREAIRTALDGASQGGSQVLYHSTSKA